MGETTTYRPRPRVAVVTGGGGGMGLAAARRLGQEMRVVLTDVDEGRLERAMDVLDDERIDATPVPCELTDETAIAELADAAERRGELGALVHTAGISPSMDPDAKRMLEVNLLATARLLDGFESRTAVGSVAVCIASVSSYRRLPDGVEPILLNPLAADFYERLAAVAPYEGKTRLAYALAKCGVRLQCERRAAAWGKRGARLCSLSPGGTLTRMVNFEKGRGGKDFVEQTALGRRGAPREIASVVAFLCGPDASYMTGCDVLVDGGVRPGFLHHASAEERERWLDAEAD